MEHNHEQRQQRLPSPESTIRVLKQKLIQMDERHTAVCALADEYEAETQVLSAMLQQVNAENQILRGRLGIAEGESIELSDDEQKTAEATGAKVYELPEREGQTPDGTEEEGQQSGSAGAVGGEQPVQAGSSGTPDHVGESEADQSKGKKAR